MSKNSFRKVSCRACAMVLEARCGKAAASVMNSSKRAHLSCISPWRMEVFLFYTEMTFSCWSKDNIQRVPHTRGILPAGVATCGSPSDFLGKFLGCLMRSCYFLVKDTFGISYIEKLFRTMPFVSKLLKDWYVNRMQICLTLGGGS